MGVEFLSENLRMLRQFHGMKLAELGEAVGASRQFIHQLESGAKLPTSEMEDALAAVLDVEPSAFRFVNSNSVKVEQTHFRKLRSTPVSTVNQVLAYGTMFENLIRYLDTKLDLPEVNFPEVHVDSDQDVEEAAIYCREYWGLSADTPISNVSRLIEGVGAVVAFFDGVSEKVDALSMSRARPIVVRSTMKESLCRQRFDLMHECGHLVMHQGVETGDKKTEGQANRFASAFLLPASPFQEEFPKGNRLDWNAIFRMKLRWKVSVQAIIRRALDLEIIDAAQYRRANIQLQRTGQKKSEKYDDQLPLEVPELLANCFTVLRENKRLYLRGIANDLGWKLPVLEKLLVSIFNELDANLFFTPNEVDGNIIKFQPANIA